MVDPLILFYYFVLALIAVPSIVYVSVYVGTCAHASATHKIVIRMADVLRRLHERPKPTRTPEDERP